MTAAVDDAPGVPGSDTVARVFREEAGRVVATLIRVLGDIDLAEDAVQDAFTVALWRWPTHGVPANPGGWITTTARNRAIDRLRRDVRGHGLLVKQALLAADGRTGEVGPVDDDRLRLIFTCCHPALATEAQVALTLRLLGGLTTAQVARAFLLSESAMAQRVVRAKRKIKAARIPYRIPRDEDLPARLQPVLAVVYLVYNAGADAPGPADPVGDDLRREALRLARMLVALMPDEPEAAGLLALLLLTEARRPARFNDEGVLVLLRDQDRTRWDRTLIDEGRRIVRMCLRRNQPGPYQIQAAIGAVHADATTAAATDWAQIVVLYDHLMAVAGSEVVALNRAVAVAEAAGPAAALAIVDSLELTGYHPFHAVRADLLRRVGRASEATMEYERAASSAPSDAVRRRLLSLRQPPAGDGCP